MSTVNSYGFEVAATDVIAALTCEGERAKSEGFDVTATRQFGNARHLRNAADHMAGICPEGHRVRVRLVVDFVPDVNAVRA